MSDNHRANYYLAMHTRFALDGRILANALVYGLGISFATAFVANVYSRALWSMCLGYIRKHRPKRWLWLTSINLFGTELPGRSGIRFWRYLHGSQDNDDPVIMGYRQRIRRAMRICLLALIIGLVMMAAICVASGFVDKV